MVAGRLLAFGAAVFFVLAACGSTDGTSDVVLATTTSAPPASSTSALEPPPSTVAAITGTVAVPAASSLVTCQSDPFDPALLEDGPTIDTLAEGPANATMDGGGIPAFDPTLDWVVVIQNADSATLVRELPEPDRRNGGDVRTHEVHILAEINGAPNVPEGSWLLVAANTCALRPVTDDGAAGSANTGSANLALADELDPESSQIELLVTEQSCASGQSAEGRIVVLQLTENADAVLVRIGVTPLGRGQNCPANPPTPFGLELAAPLGDRPVLDASFAPPRPIEIDVP